jgi:hypothetical protein
LTVWAPDTPAAKVRAHLRVDLLFEVHAEHLSESKDEDRHDSELLAKVFDASPPSLEQLRNLSRALPIGVAFDLERVEPGARSVDESWTSGTSVGSPTAGASMWTSVRQNRHHHRHAFIRTVVARASRHEPIRHRTAVGAPPASRLTDRFRMGRHSGDGRERAMRNPTSSIRKVGWLRRRTEARQLQCSSDHPPPRSTR